MTNDIQRARDVLAKWRENPTGMPWQLGDRSPWHDDEVTVETADKMGDVSGDYMDEDSARLIVGTAGNPDLLDAIDGFLSMVASGALRDRQQHAERIAAAVISADERMSA